jgi:hypothetical protein
MLVIRSDQHELLDVAKQLRSLALSQDAEDALVSLPKLAAGRVPFPRQMTQGTSAS